MIKNYYPKTYLQQHFFRIAHSFLRPFSDKSLQLTWIHANQNSKSYNDRLFDLAINMIQNTKNIDLSDIESRQKTDKRWIEIYPGEHYKLLASLVNTVQPKIVLELGTYLGHASLTIKKYLPKNGVLHTFDVFKWNQFEDTCFKESDFDGQLIQYIDDLTRLNDVERHKDIIQNADIIFLDALKDGKQEKLFLNNFKKLGIKDGTLLFFDDIRVWNMIKVWSEIDMPKIDLTSFGHWSGSGLVEWKN